MHYVVMLKWQPGLTREQRDGALMRRAQWEFPENLKVIGEYWPVGDDPAVVTIVETDDVAAFMELEFTWSDVFQFTVTPAVTAEEGLKLGPDLLAKRSV